MKNTAEHYEECALALASAPVPDAVAEAQLYATLAQAAAVAELTEAVRPSLPAKLEVGGAG